MSELVTTTLGTVEHREVTEAGEERREVYGIACPFDASADLGNGVLERIAPGAFGTPSGVTLRAEGHANVVGRVVELTETPTGLHYRAVISRTAAGDDTWQLVKDGALHSASVGFLPGQSGTDPDGTIVRRSGRLLHVALTGEPAYPSARVLAFREAITDEDTVTSTDTTPDTSSTEKETMSTDLDVAGELATLRTEQENLERRVAAMAVNTTIPSAPASRQYRSAGEWLKAIAAGDDAAVAIAKRDISGVVTAEGVQYRDFTTVADQGAALQHSWLASKFKFVDDSRVSLSAFSRGSLPSTGMTVEYAKLDLAGSTLAVAQQVNEGDLLAYSEIHMTTASAPVKTYGGYGSISRQAVERSQVNVVDTLYQGLLAKYAQVTSAAFNTALAAASTATVVRANSTGTSTAAQWDAAIVTAIGQLASSGLGLPAEFMLIDLTTFATLKALRVSDNPFLGVVGATPPTVGTVSVRSLAGTIDGLPVLVDPTLPANSVYVANSAAMQTLESGGPNRLTDSDITHLTNDYSVYGYLAFTAPFAADGIRKIITS